MTSRDGKKPNRFHSLVSCGMLCTAFYFFVECCCCFDQLWPFKGVFFNVGNGTTGNGAMVCRTLPTKPAENASCPPKYGVRRPGEGHLVSPLIA